MDESKPDARGASGEGLGKGLEDRYPHRVGCQTLNNNGQEASNMIKVTRSVVLNDNTSGRNTG